MKNIFRTITIASIAAIINSACTEKIDLKLKNSEPQITIEGRVNDKPGPYYVAITKSRLYTENNDFTGIGGAQVIISDDAGNVDTLTPGFITGLYQTNFIQGTVGRTYMLSTTVEGTTYVSLCKMNPPVDIDTILISTETNFQGETKTTTKMQIHDPAGVPNYYQVFSVRDGYHAQHRDRLWDGKIREFNIPNKGLSSGDTLEAELWSISERVYTFFDQFDQNQNNFGAPAAPANPDAVFTPAALGYFSAHSIKSKTVIIP